MSSAAPCRSLPLWVSCTAQLLVVLDVSVVNVALPSIRADLAIGPALSAWVALAYTLGFAGALLAGARLADVFGTGVVLPWGLALFTLAGTLGGLAPDGAVLVGARAVQGLCAAVVSPATFALLTTAFAEGRERIRAVAAWTAVSLAGGGIGNILSGALTDLVSWRAVLLINLPIGGAVLVGAVLLRRRTPAGGKRARIDPAGALLATAGLTCAAYALSAVGEGATAASGAAAAAGAVLFALFLAHQRRTDHPLVPPGLLRNRAVVCGNIATVLAGTCFQVALWYFLTFRMQGQLGFSALQAGFAFLPLTAAMLAVNTWITPRLMERLRPRALVGLGAVLASFGLVWLGLGGAGQFVSALLGPSLVIGIGGGLLNTPLATAVTTGVPADEAGAASGLMNTGKQFGGALGLAAASAAAAASGTDRGAFLLLAGLVAAAAVAAALLPAGRPVHPPVEPAARRDAR
ncbi:MFS transporter [Streptomonospora wellingtoniae]|uniref:MFS transporter n=1 Tax=Streptomonospora wellingtoniae TaxID=3075544 RepID=A0ABU2KNT5_9ACTN|nr:MFS transporter [Streptomonospora sp. DSM 45055]MDT0300932.1 MFS transporter [Streptomonospora sp. DSM 45055]